MLLTEVRGRHAHLVLHVHGGVALVDQQVQARLTTAETTSHSSTEECQWRPLYSPLPLSSSRYRHVSLPLRPHRATSRQPGSVSQGPPSSNGDRTPSQVPCLRSARLRPWTLQALHKGATGPSEANPVIVSLHLTNCQTRGLLAFSVPHSLLGRRNVEPPTCLLRRGWACLRSCPAG